MTQHTRRPVVRAVVFDAEPAAARSLLLVHHHHAEERPGRSGPSDFWCFPGGGVEAGEGIVAAARREMLEETGLEIRPLGVGWLQDVVAPPWLELYVWAVASGGTLALGFDPERAGGPAVLKEATFVPLDELPGRRLLPPALAERLHVEQTRLDRWPLLPLPEPVRF